MISTATDQRPDAARSDALVAIGYTLIFGVLNLLYFAHGEMFMIGAFAGLFLVVYAGANIYGALTARWWRALSSA